MPNVKPLRVTITIEDAEIPWSDVMDAVQVVPDTDMSDAPWDNDDGWKHETEHPLSRYSGFRGNFSEEHMRSIRYVGRSRRSGGDVWLVIDPDEMGLTSWQSFHAMGASKQVARELAAEHLRRAYSQLHTWYANGWEYWGVTVDLHDCHASAWGIDDYDYAYKDTRREIADELADELTAAGYVITNRPTPEHEKHSAAYNRYVNNPHGVNVFNVSRR